MYLVCDIDFCNHSIQFLKEPCMNRVDGNLGLDKDQSRGVAEVGLMGAEVGLVGAEVRVREC